MKNKILNHLLAGVGIIVLAQAVATHISQACWYAASQDETPNCIK